MACTERMEAGAQQGRARCDHAARPPDLGEHGDGGNISSSGAGFIAEEDRDAAAEVYIRYEKHGGVKMVGQMAGLGGSLGGGGGAGEGR